MKSKRKKVSGKAAAAEAILQAMQRDEVAQQQAAAVIIEKPPSRHAGKQFLSGSIGVALADAHDETEEALGAISFKFAQEPISREPFCRDPKKRAFFASFVDTREHQPIIWPDMKALREAKRVPMDEETKALLRERSMAKRSLRPKPAPGAYLLQTLCDEFNIKNPAACAALRKAKTPKPDHGRWAWASKEEAVELFTKLGMIGAKKTDAPKQQEKKSAPETVAAIADAARKVVKAVKQQKKREAPKQKKSATKKRGRK